MMLNVFLLALCTAGTGCVHRIQVVPLSTGESSFAIPRTLQVVVNPISMEGPDHRPGIALLEWPHLDLNQAIVGYLQQRGTFASISPDSADLTLRVTAKLTLTSRIGIYHYRIALHAEMSEATRPIKSYRAEQIAVGSSVRWVTASDRVPIKAALQAVLEDVMRQVEKDGPIYVGRTEQPSQKPPHDKPSVDS